MTKAVTWSSCSRLACASAQSPDIVICVTDPELLAPIICEDETTYQPTTLDGVLTKVYRDSGPCGTGVFRYVLSYDQAQLLDPTTALSADQVDGVFCKGCLTTWVDDEINRALCSHGTGITCVADTDTVTLSIDEDGCLEAAAVGGGGGCDCFQPLYSSTCDGTYDFPTAESSDGILGAYTIPAAQLNAPGTRIDFKCWGHIHLKNIGVIPNDSFVSAEILFGTPAPLPPVIGGVAYQITLDPDEEFTMRWTIEGTFTKNSNLPGTIKYQFTTCTAGVVPPLTLPVIGVTAAIDTGLPLDIQVWSQNAIQFQADTEGTATLEGFTVDSVGLPLSVAECG